tara:strand:- start:53 stop:478 length:426 start_codon:yes stop_codon:yes gene_type:complete
MALKEVKSFKENESLFIINLRNKSYVRINSINNKYISTKNHTVWYKNFLKNKKNKFYLIKYYKKNIGYIRVENKNNKNFTSWAILKKYSKKGFATKNLKKVTKSKRKYFAIIKENNIASTKVAIKSGFKFLIKNKNFVFIK